MGRRGEGRGGRDGQGMDGEEKNRERGTARGMRTYLAIDFLHASCQWDIASA